MELDLTAVKTAFAQFSGEAADETGTQREALCAALCGQCARQVASLVRRPRPFTSCCSRRRP